MRIVFWQNVLSPHQLPYISKLILDKRVDSVVVVAGKAVSASRKKMGWTMGHYDGLDKCQVYVNPHDSIIESILSQKQNDTWHLFSGIRADKFVFKCLKKSMTYHLHRGMITEKPNTYDFKLNIQNVRPLLFHRIRFALQDYKYAKHMEIVFAMGTHAVKYFKSVCNRWKVYPFGYCTQTIGSLQANPKLGGGNLTFVGSLSARKNPLSILEAYNLIDKNKKDRIHSISYIGDGPLMSKLTGLIVKYNLADKFKLLGTKLQTEIPKFLSDSDVLILPSLYDGWGAVVNEALQSGCFVIISDACGAKMLVENDSRLGLVFHHGSKHELAKCLTYLTDNLNKIREDKLHRIQWANDHISGQVMAKYMVDCLESVSNKK